MTVCGSVAYGTWATQHLPFCELPAGHKEEHKAKTRLCVGEGSVFRSVERTWNNYGIVRVERFFA